MRFLLKMRYSINLHKALTIPICLCLIYFYESYGLRSFLYLALHGSYIALWFFKELSFPDKTWDKEVPLPTFLAAFLGLGPLGYWIGMTLAINNKTDPSPLLLCLAVSLEMFGVFFHFTADMQKYATLKYRPGLIQDGLFAICRNTNYFGEFLIYLSFSVVAAHWLPLVIHAAFAFFIYLPNMVQKEKSLARYEEFENYCKRTWMFLPKIV